MQGRSVLPALLFHWYYEGWCVKVSELARKKERTPQRPP